MTTQISPLAVQRFVDNNGNALVGGLLYTYAAGTSTPQATYTDSTGSQVQTNPIVLNFRGEATFWLDPILSYKLNLTDSQGNQIPGWPVDNIPGGIGIANITPINFSLVPSPSNTYTLGTSIASWANAYLGAHAEPALDTTTQIIGYFPRTAAEIASGVTPSSYGIPSHSIVGGVLLERYGGGNSATGTVNSAAFANAVLVCGQLDLPIFLTAGPVAWQFSSAWTLTGTGQALAGLGAPVGGVGATGCRVIGIGGRPLVQFSGLSGSTDCVTVGGANLPQVELRNLQFNFNASGRDGLVNNGSNMPVYENLFLWNSARDAEVQAVSSSNFIEKGTFRNIEIRSAGRHAMTRSLAGSSGAYINEGYYEQIEVRGVSAITAGGAVLYMTSTASGGGSKFSNHFYSKFNWDCIFTNGAIPCESPILIDSGVSQNLTLGIGGWENTGGVLPSVTPTGASGTGTTATLTFAALATAPAVGSYIAVTGMNPSGYNTAGSQIIASSTSSVSYANSTTGAFVSAGSIALNGFYNKIMGSGVMGGFALLPGCLTNSFWGSAGVNPATSIYTAFDNSFVSSAFSSPTITGPVVQSYPANTLGYLMSGNTTTNAVADKRISRSGTASATQGQNSNIQLDNSTSGVVNTGIDLGEFNGALYFYSYTSGTWTWRSSFNAAGGLTLNSVATTGTQTATFTATNKPGSGTTAPAKWLPIVCDGTTYYIPLWT